MAINYPVPCNDLLLCVHGRYLDRKENRGMGLETPVIEKTDGQTHLTQSEYLLTKRTSQVDFNINWLLSVL